MNQTCHRGSCHRWEITSSCSTVRAREESLSLLTTIQTFSRFFFHPLCCEWKHEERRLVLCVWWWVDDDTGSVYLFMLPWRAAGNLNKLMWRTGRQHEPFIQLSATEVPVTEITETNKAHSYTAGSRHHSSTRPWAHFPLKYSLI